MPLEIEHEGKKITVWTEDDMAAEIRGLKFTNENLKSEKRDLIDKMTGMKDVTRELEEAKAKAEGDNETLRRIADEREAEKKQAVEDERKKFSDLLGMTKLEKIDNFLTGLVQDINPVDATSAKHLRKLIKSDYQFDVDLEKGEFTVKGNGVSNPDELKKILREGEEYQRYIAGSGATGGGAAGGKPTGGVGEPKNQAAEDARKKGDLTGFLTANLNTR